MAVYAIGDIQGCFDPLQRLLDQIQFDPARDRLWFAGDLVNRGPKSLETLRFIKGLGGRALTVLGNHDLHLLAVWQHRHRRFKSRDTLGAVLDAPDCEELLDWLRRRPLMFHDAELDTVLVHAGLSPQWDLDTAEKCAREVEAALQGPDFHAFLEHMYGNEPKRWSESLHGWERLRFSVNCFTRLRYCTPDGSLDFHHKGKPGSQNSGYLPWFKIEARPTRTTRIVFGHWSTLGLYVGDGVCALDTGCLWGGRLTAMQLDHRDLPVWTVQCPAEKSPARL